MTSVNKQDKIAQLNASKKAADAGIKVDGRSTHKTLDAKAKLVGHKFKPVKK